MRCLDLNIIASFGGHGTGGRDSTSVAHKIREKLGLVEAKEDEGGAVHVLTDDTFQDYIASHNVAVVEFYAPWWVHGTAQHRALPC